MALLVTAKVNYERARREHNAKEFEQTQVNATFKYLTNQVQLFKNAGADKNKATKDDFLRLQATAMLYEVKGENLSTQLEVLKNQMESFKKWQDGSIQKSVPKFS